MPLPPLILVDTTVWVRFFRRPGAQESKDLDRLLENDVVATCDPIRAEVLSGALHEGDFQRLETLFGALEHLEAPDQIWHRISKERFHLARKGYFCSLVDIWIAIVAQFHHAPLWTLDKDFRSIISAIPFEMFGGIQENS